MNSKAFIKLVSGRRLLTHNDTGKSKISVGTMNLCTPSTRLAPYATI